MSREPISSQAIEECFIGEVNLAAEDFPCGNIYARRHFVDVTWDNLASCILTSTGGLYYFECFLVSSISNYVDPRAVIRYIEESVYYVIWHVEMLSRKVADGI